MSAAGLGGLAMNNAPSAPGERSPYPDDCPACSTFPRDVGFRDRLREILGDALLVREQAPGPREAVLVDCLDSTDATKQARSACCGHPLVSVLREHDPAQIIAALAQGAAGVLALTDPPASWRECLRVVMGGGRWLGGPGLEISLEERYAVYDVARREDHPGDVTMRTKLYVRQRVADKFRT